MTVPRHIEDKLLTGWHRTYGWRRGEFSPGQSAVRQSLQRRGLLGFDLTIIAEAVRRIWQ